MTKGVTANFELKNTIQQHTSKNREMPLNYINALHL